MSFFIKSDNDIQELTEPRAVEAARIDVSIHNRNSPEDPWLVWDLPELPPNFTLDKTSGKFRPRTYEERAVVEGEATIKSELVNSVRTQIRVRRREKQESATVTHSKGIFPCDPDTLDAIMGVYQMVVAGISIPGGARIRDAEENLVSVTQADLEEIAGQINIAISGLNETAKLHRDQTDSLSVAELSAYDVRAAWP